MYTIKREEAVDMGDYGDDQGMTTVCRYYGNDKDPDALRKHLEDHGFTSIDREKTLWMKKGSRFGLCWIIEIEGLEKLEV